MNLVSTLLTDKVTANSTNRFSQDSANLKVNGWLIDVSFVVPETVGDTPYSGGWDFLKDFYLNEGLRLGSGNGSAEQLISSCSLYQLLAYSDKEMGVSMESTKFEPGKRVRISGYLYEGYFAMGARDALTTALNVAVKPTYNNEVIPVDFTISAVYKREEPVQLRTYQSCSPTGADQPYTNVLEIMYDCKEIMNKDCVITDQLGGQYVNIEDAIALCNADSHFEFFNRVGTLYREPTGLSQNLSFKIPVTDTERQEILIVGLCFNPDLLISNASETGAVRQELLTKIQNSDSKKFAYWQALGLA